MSSRTVATQAELDKAIADRVDYRRKAGPAVTTHVHCFRRIGGQWICADEACLMPLAAMATPQCDQFCTEPCPYCDARDFALLRNYVDPYAAIAQNGADRGRP